MSNKKHNHPTIEPPIRFLDIHSVVELTSLRKTTIYELMRHGEFPRQRLLSKRSARWIESEIQSWMEEKAVS